MVKSGYQRIHLNSFGNSLKSLAFKSPDSSKIILQLFTESAHGNFDVEIPNGTISIEHYITSNSSSENFTSVSTDNLDLQANFMEMAMGAMSFHTLVFNIDSSLSYETNDVRPDDLKIVAYPNPVKSQLNLRFNNNKPREISIYQYNGSLIYNKNYPATKDLVIDVRFLESGLYILKSSTPAGQQTVKFIIDNQ